MSVFHSYFYAYLYEEIWRKTQVCVFLKQMIYLFGNLHTRISSYLACFYSDTYYVNGFINLHYPTSTQVSCLFYIESQCLHSQLPKTLSWKCSRENTHKYWYKIIQRNNLLVVFTVLIPKFTFFLRQSIVQDFGRWKLIPLYTYLMQKMWRVLWCMTYSLSGSA